MRSVVIRHYQTSEPLVLESETLTELLARSGKRLTVTPAGGEAVTLTAGSDIGLIRVKGLDLVVQPKIPLLSVFWMLGYADRIVPFDPSEFAYEVEPGLLDILARLFARQTELLIRRGWRTRRR